MSVDASSQNKFEWKVLVMLAYLLGPMESVIRELLNRAVAGDSGWNLCDGGILIN